MKPYGSKKNPGSGWRDWPTRWLARQMTRAARFLGRQEAQDPEERMRRIHGLLVDNATLQAEPETYKALMELTGPRASFDRCYMSRDEWADILCTCPTCHSYGEEQALGEVRPCRTCSVRSADDPACSFDRCTLRLHHQGRHCSFVPGCDPDWLASGLTAPNVVLSYDHETPLPKPPQPPGGSDDVP